MKIMLKSDVLLYNIIYNDKKFDFYEWRYVLKEGEKMRLLDSKELMNIQFVLFLDENSKF